MNIFDEVMLPNVRRRYCKEGHPRIVVVKDNSPIHIARITRAWYKNHPEIVRLNWPPKSRDLNVIENFLAEMVRQRTPHIVHRRENLVQQVHLAWADLHQCPDYCQAIVNSMHCRLLAVLASEGEDLNYWEVIHGNKILSSSVFQGHPLYDRGNRGGFSR